MGADVNLSTATIKKLESVLLQMPQADIVTVHRFKPGIYEREITIPPWTILSGAEHKTAYRVILSKGRIGVNTDEGMCILDAPAELYCKAGAQRIGRVFESAVIWTDIYENPDDCQDLDVLEERLYLCDQLGDNARIERDRKDYLTFIDEIGVPQARIEAIVTNHDDLVSMPDGFDVEVKSSRLHGLGLYALRAFATGEIICPGRVDGHRTPAGRFINHSRTPNAKSFRVDDDIAAMAIREIRAGEEVLIDYRDALRVNKELTLCLAG